MAIAASLLLLFLQLSTIFSSAVILQSRDCDNDWLAHAYSSLGEEIFYINGNVVNKIVFCEALQLYIEKDCGLKDYFGSNNCAFDASFVKLPSKAGRRLLQKDLSNKPTTSQGDSKPLPTFKVGIFAGGALLACCVVLCPCFYAKRRNATSHAVLAKDPHSMDSVSSLEGNSVSAKVPTSPVRVPPSPHRVPPSPHRVPPSPHRVPPSPSRFSMSPKLGKLDSLQLNLSQVVRATRNFSESLQIGEGGFGTVYKAELEDGVIVAVKRAKREQLDSLRAEFRSEVELLAKIEHRNLVKLLGYIDKENERILITEFVPNGTLREHLDGLRGRILDFNQRLEIAIDVAHGLTYLHQYAEKQIIHRDVKSSNILLTESMRAKVADFGFAKLGSMNSDQTHISTKVKGTVGYLDPEYMKTNQLTTKSDVYSFGILLLEIVTGRRPVELKKTVEERVTLRWAFRKFNEGSFVELVDPLMEEAINRDVGMKIFDLAFQCAAPVRADRPDMKSVVEKLWTIRAYYLKSPRRE